MSKETEKLRVVATIERSATRALSWSGCDMPNLVECFTNGNPTVLQAELARIDNTLRIKLVEIDRARRMLAMLGEANGAEAILTEIEEMRK